MKTKNMIWAALSMTAALVMTACSNDDNTVETPAAQQAIVKTIPYSVTVNGGAGTRATVDNDMKTLKFATGDKLYITGTNISGVLALKSGDESKSSGATFEGDLTYTGAGSPASDLALTATLVSAQQTDGTEVTINSTTKAVTVNYPTTAYCDDVATAVQKYSNLTGTSTYSAKSFTLSQNTAFLNFVITFEDATTTGTGLSAVVSNNSAAICTANVTTVTDNGVKAKFVLPVAKGTTLSSANVKFGDKAAISFGASQTLDGKVYNVTKTQAAAVLSESFNTNQGIATYDGTHFTITCTAEGDSDGIEIEDSNPLTITAKNGETITRVEFHCKFGSAHASQTTVTAGTLNWTTDSETGSIDNVNASTVSMSNSTTDWVQIDQITVYYQ